MLNNEVLRNQLISRRTFLSGAGKFGLIGLLISRLFYIQLIKRDEYTLLADKNRINLIVLPPIRGQIIDIAGNIIAKDEKCFRLLLDKTFSKEYLKDIDLISQILQLTPEQKLYILNKAKKAGSRIPIPIIDQLRWNQIALVEEHKINLHSVFIDTSHARYYPIGLTTSHLLGYTGQASEEDKRELMLGNNISDFNVGKSGIEKSYEKTLQGEFGYKQIEVNAYGRYIREISSVHSRPGKNLHLNIDSELQNQIYPYLNRNGCSAIVMDCTNGDVLILASTPTYDSNNFTKLSKDYWSSLLSDPFKPLINKAVQSAYPPGSIFKIITILAALESGIDPNKVVNCTGGPVIGGNRFRCHNKNGHGKITMSDAIKYSCNPYMYEMARLIGPDRILSVAKKFGFGVLTGIDIASEVPGFLPSRSWKKSKYNSDWTLGDSFNLSIGQGFLLATPLQLARFSAAIASDGKLFTPNIAQSKEINYQQIDIDKEHLKLIKEAMYQTVNSPGGAAYHGRILQLSHKLAGKTGTSQVVAKANANDDLSRESVSWKKRNHAIFIGFGPYNNPRYSISVFIDHGGGGGRVAAPIASHIMLDVFQKYC